MNLIEKNQFALILTLAISLVIVLLLWLSKKSLPLVKMMHHWKTRFNERDHVLSEGRLAEAEILELKRLPILIEESTFIHLKMKILDQNEAYILETQMLIPNIYIARIQLHNVLPIKIDREDRNNVFFIDIDYT